MTSLIQHWSEIGLYGFVDRVIDYYRAVAHAAKEALFDWWMLSLWPGFKLPEWFADVVSIWCFCAAGVLRLGADLSQTIGGTTVPPLKTIALVCFFAPVFFVWYGVIMLAYCFARNEVAGYRMRLRDRLLPVSGALILLFAPLIGAAAFFVWGAIEL